jgi:hypothetical protein
MPDINSAYYQQLTTSLQTCDVGQFSAIVSRHKANMLAAKFDQPSEKVFAENLAWVADKVILQPNTRSYKEPADITDADLRKLEILREEFGFDYMKDLLIGFTATRDGTRLEYKEPFLVYLASKTGDFTDFQARVIEELVEGVANRTREGTLGVSYAMRSGRGNNHNDDKNLFHVLLEGELTPNKKRIADLVAPELGTKIFLIHAATESWDSSRGGKVYQSYDAHRNALHCAVSSGRLENVEYALSKGVRQSTRYSGYGSTAFADASRAMPSRNTTPSRGAYLKTR